MINYRPADYDSEYAQKSRIAKENMKRYVDPRSGTVSYSGADFTAVVFLPMSLSQYNSKLYQIENDTRFVQEEIQRPGAVGGLGHIESLRDQLKILNTEKERIIKLRDSGEKHIRPIKLFDVQTITMSSHREKFPVRTLGRINAKSYTRGPRTLAGTMIFTLFNKHALWDLVQATSSFYSSGVSTISDSGYPELSAVLVDQLPPFDITLVASNELGDSSYMVLYGVEIVNDGRTISIQDIITENSMQFFCRDFEDLRPMLSKRSSLARGYFGNVKSASEVARERTTELERRGIRLNPFI